MLVSGLSQRKFHSAGTERAGGAATPQNPIPPNPESVGENPLIVYADHLRTRHELSKWSQVLSEGKTLTGTIWNFNPSIGNKQWVRIFNGDIKKSNNQNILSVRGRHDNETRILGIGIQGITVGTNSYLLFDLKEKTETGAPPSVPKDLNEGHSTATRTSVSELAQASSTTENSNVQIGQDETFSVNSSNPDTLNEILDTACKRFLNTCEAILIDPNLAVNAHNDKRFVHYWSHGGNNISKIDEARKAHPNLVHEFTPTIRAILKNNNQIVGEIFNFIGITALKCFEMGQDGYLFVEKSNERLYDLGLDLLQGLNPRSKVELQVLVEYPNLPEGVKTEKYLCQSVNIEPVISEVKPKPVIGQVLAQAPAATTKSIEFIEPVTITEFDSTYGIPSAQVSNLVRNKLNLLHNTNTLNRFVNDGQYPKFKLPGYEIILVRDGQEISVLKEPIIKVFECSRDPFRPSQAMGIAYETITSVEAKPFCELKVGDTIKVNLVELGDNLETISEGNKVEYKGPNTSTDRRRESSFAHNLQSEAYRAAFNYRGGETIGFQTIHTDSQGNQTVIITNHILPISEIPNLNISDTLQTNVVVLPRQIGAK